MADLVVALPEPHPEDDEDVVWGLSTASALWARGERRDAIVWLRRAVEAADAAGQPFRASELGLCVTALEEVLSADPMRRSISDADAIRLSASDIEDTVSQSSEDIELDEATVPNIDLRAVQRASRQPPLAVDPFDLPTIPHLPRLPPPVLPPSRPPPQVPRAVDGGSGSAARSAMPHPPAPNHPPGSSSQPPAPHPVRATPVPQRPSSYPQATAPSQQPQGVAFAPQQGAPGPQAPPPPSMRPHGIAAEPRLPPPARVPSGPSPSVRPPSMRPSPPVPFSAPLTSTSVRRSSAPPRPSSLPLSPAPPPTPPSPAVPPTGTRARMDSVTTPAFVPRPTGARYSSDTPPAFAHPPSTSRAGSHPPPPPASPAAHPPSAPTSSPPLAAPPPPPAQVPATPPPPPPSINPAAQRDQDPDPEEPHAEGAPTSTVKGASKAGPPSVPGQGRSKPRARTPILDPWSEDAEHAAPPRPARDLVTVSGDAFLVARRTQAQNENEEAEEEVITSAVSLDLALKRKAVPARPPPVPPQAASRAKPAAPAAGEPGSLAAAALPSVSAKSGAADELRADDDKAAEQPSEVQPSGTATAAVAAESPAHEPPPRPAPGDAPVASEEPSAHANGSRKPPQPSTSEQPPEAAAIPASPAVAASAPAASADQAETSAPEPLAVQEPAALPIDEGAAPAPPAPSMEESAPPQEALAPPPLQLDPSAAPLVDAAREPAEGASAEPAIDVNVAKPDSATSAPRTAGALGGRDLEQVDAFADLPEEMHDELARAAHVDRLTENEELSGFGAALVLEGNAAVCTTIVDMPAHRAVTKTLVPSRGTLSERIPLRIVAGTGGARVAIWDQAIIDNALRSCPWVMDELRAVADRLQALAGATMGPLGNLDEEPLGRILARLSLRILQPAEQLISAGSPMPGLIVVGAGSLELVADRTAQLQGTARSGDLLFAAALLAGQPAPIDVRAASGGALILLGEHPVLRELFESTPELVSLLAQEA